MRLKRGGTFMKERPVTEQRDRRASGTEDSAQIVRIIRPAPSTDVQPGRSDREVDNRR
ncbi:MAG TPA: hypothetical protein VMH41_15285 [Mycobacteriales bacterium]|nr:hypothetical protein [Mycobacteriales bacterium]